MKNDNKVQSIFSVKHYLNITSVSIIWFCGVLFAFKLFDNPAPKIVLYSALLVLIIYTVEKSERFYSKFLTHNILFLIMLIITASSILLYRLDYIGYPSIAGFTIFWLAVIYQTKNIKIILLQILIFLLSPVLYSEVLSFSGVFTLTMLLIVSIMISERFLNDNKLDWKFFLIALLFGITLAASLLAGFAYILYLLLRFRSNFRNGAIFILAVIAAYTLLMLRGDEGLMSISGSQVFIFQIMPIWVLISLIIFCFYIGWIAADLQETLFTSGIIYFILFIVSSITLITQPIWNWIQIDFPLMEMAIPFLVLSIKDYKVNRFLGKVLNDIE